MHPYVPASELVNSPEEFILDGAYGPLHAGEIERAKDWGARLVRRSLATSSVGGTPLLLNDQESTILVFFRS
jgi:hypothetical protein